MGPPLSETWCDATTWATVKVTWELTVSVPEHGALDGVFGTC